MIKSVCAHRKLFDRLAAAGDESDESLKSNKVIKQDFYLDSLYLNQK